MPIGASYFISSMNEVVMNRKVEKNFLFAESYKRG